MKHFLQLIFALMLVVLALPSTAQATRIKDLAHVQGVRENQLIGYGLVVGLAGTGDYGQSEFTVQSTASMLSRMGIKVDKKQLKTRNVAAVIVTADLPPFSRSGQRLDIVVSSLGNARSLQGGTLLMAPLKGADDKVYAVAQGALSVGGYQVSGGLGNTAMKNHVTAGHIPSGAIVERDVAVDMSKRESIRLVLRMPDFATASEMARVVSEFFKSPEAPQPEAAQDPNANPPVSAEGPDEESKAPEPQAGIARAVDASTVQVTVPQNFQEHVPQFIGIVELLDVTPSQSARVVVNERTGTVVLGGDVRIREVAVAHGNLNVTISTQYDASQPSSFGRGKTQVLPDRNVDVAEGNGAIQVVSPGASITDVVSALNALGATPRDLIAILQAIEAAGALDARLMVQ